MAKRTEHRSGMSGRVAGKAALVTGAGSGIGRATAVTLAREGACVVVTDIDAPSGQETAAIISQAGGQAFFHRADVVSSDDVQALMAAVSEAFGRLDILHNNAGVAVRHPVAEQDEEGWDHCFSVNLKGLFLCSKYAIPHMRQHGGSIIHTASVTGIVGVRNRAAYSATKGAIVILTRNMALDYARYHIRVNCVCPGFTRTALIGRLLEDSERTRRLTEMHPLGRLGMPEDIANAVLFLASDEASWITGHALVVDGGFSAGRPEDI
jgi:NAD(P)-dependent dehydrogenase (short-subunit alcohol dehydrogenase family)